MPRPRSDEKRSAILEAATRIIVTQGLSAPTAGIAKEAGVANGSLFTYFETKTDLFNQLYLELKAEMASATLKNLPVSAGLHEQFFHVWRNWMNWALSNPEKRGYWHNSVYPTRSPRRPVRRGTRPWHPSPNCWNVVAPTDLCRKPQWASLLRS